MTGMSRVVKLACIVLAAIGLLTGCWDRVDIDNRLFVLGWAVDVAKGEEAKLGRYRFTAEMPIVPQGVEPGGGGGSGGGGGGGGQGGMLQATRVETIIADSNFGAIRMMADRSSKVLFFGHTMVLIISEEAARTGINKLLDLFSRDPETQRPIKVFITPGCASDVFKARPKVDNIPSIYVNNIFINMRKTSRMINSNLNRINMSIRQKTGFLVPKLVPGKDDLKVAGAAVFREDKFRGWLDEDETVAANIVLNMAKGGALDVKVNGRLVTYEIINSHTEIRLERRGDSFEFYIETLLEGNIGDVFSNTRMHMDDRSIKQVDAAVSKAAKQMIDNLIQRSQTELATDFLKFGNVVRAKAPDYWKTHQDTWQEDYCHIPVNTKVHVRTRRFGLLF